KRETAGEFWRSLPAKRVARQVQRGKELAGGQGDAEEDCRAWKQNSAEESMAAQKSITTAAQQGIEQQEQGEHVGSLGVSREKQAGVGNGDEQEIPAATLVVEALPAHHDQRTRRQCQKHGHVTGVDADRGDTAGGPYPAAQHGDGARQSEAPQVAGE